LQKGVSGQIHKSIIRFRGHFGMRFFNPPDIPLSLALAALAGLVPARLGDE
jgi:hypothetical protein